jgi:hypothetical protein
MIALMIAGAMLTFIPQIADPYMTPRLLLVALGAACLLLMKSNKETTLEAPAFAMVAAAMVSALYGHDRFYSIIGSYQFGMDSLLAIACYFAVLLAAGRSGMSVDNAARTITVASIPVSVYGILQRHFHDPLIWVDLHSGARVASTQGGPIFLGAVLAVAALCAAHLARKGDRLAQIALPLALWCLWYTQTRGAVLATGLGVAFMFRGAVWVAIPAVVLMPRFFHSAISDLARMEVWKIALAVFRDNPLTGYGNGTFYLAFRRYANWNLVDVAGSQYVQAHAHNDILHVLATMGLIGLAAYLFLGYSMLRVALNHPERKFLLGLLAAYVALSAFNPVTQSAFVMLAVLFGVASARVQVIAQRRIGPALAALVVFASVSRLTLADYHYAKAGVNNNDVQLSAMEFQRAAELNPWEMFYSCRQVDSLMRLIPYMPLEQRRPLALAGRQLAVDAVARHPEDSYAHELLGKQILVGYIAGYRDISPRIALESFNRAQELAPTFEILMWRRRNTAEQLGDADQVSFADKDINDLRAAIASGKKG